MENKEKEKKDKKPKKTEQEYNLEDLKENYKIGIEYFENVEKE